LFLTFNSAGPLRGQQIQPSVVHIGVREALRLAQPGARAPFRSLRTALGILVGGVLGGAVGFALGTRGGPCDFDRNRGNCGFGLPLAVVVGVASGAVVGGVVGALSAHAGADH
jgi:hypothetical protein